MSPSLSQRRAQSRHLVSPRGRGRKGGGTKALRPPRPPPPRSRSPCAALTGHAEPDTVAALVAVVDVASELDAAEVAAVVGQGEALHEQREVVAARVAQQPEAAVQTDCRLAELAAPRRRAPEHLRARVRLARAPDGRERPVVVAVRVREGAGQHGRLACRRAHLGRHVHGPALRRLTCGRRQGE